MIATLVPMSNLAVVECSGDWPSSQDDRTVFPLTTTKNFVDAEADPQGVLGRLDVNVAGVVTDASRQNAIDDRRGEFLRVPILQIELQTGFARFSALRC
jgi:hypothetical protein